MASAFTSRPSPCQTSFRILRLLCQEGGRGEGGEEGEGRREVYQEASMGEKAAWPEEL